jgi:hypothetical protein
MADSVKDRVYAAAEQISAERRPTVSTVRAAAGVSNADATRYLKEWSEERAAAGSQVAATPPALLEQATRLAGACWAEASTVAAERHAAVEAAWVQEKKDKDLEIAELVADLDKTSAEKDTAAAQAEVKIAELEQQLTALGDQLRDARAAEHAAQEQAQAAATQLAAAEARNTALSEAHEALLQRITPASSDTNESE